MAHYSYFWTVVLFAPRQMAPPNPPSTNSNSSPSGNPRDPRLILRNARLAQRPIQTNTSLHIPIQVRPTTSADGTNIPSSRTEGNRLCPSSLALPGTGSGDSRARQSITSVSNMDMKEAMCTAALKELKASAATAKRLEEFMASASILQNSIGEQGEIHCFITVKGPPGSQSRESTQLYPLLSKDFLTALHGSCTGSAVAAHALRDAFLIARRVSGERIPVAASVPIAPRASTQNLLRPASIAAPEAEAATEKIPILSLPEWFPCESIPTTASEASENLTNDRPKFILCRDSVIRDLIRLGVPKVSEIYATFFSAMWNIGYKKRLVSGRITYARMTPLWLRENVIFIYALRRIPPLATCQSRRFCCCCFYFSFSRTCFIYRRTHK